MNAQEILQILIDTVNRYIEAHQEFEEVAVIISQQLWDTFRKAKLISGDDYLEKYDIKFKTIITDELDCHDIMIGNAPVVEKYLDVVKYMGELYEMLTEARV